MSENERFPKDVFRPILEQTMLMDGLREGQELDITFKDVKAGDVSIHTCYGDIYKIVNALRDYSRLLLATCDAWQLSGFHRATYEYYAQKAREIADKYQQAIGYDYDKALEHCRKRQARKKDQGSDDVGGEALELMLR